MFVVKFRQVTGEPFKADKNGNFPFIGEVLAGRAKGTIYNGTMFLREDFKENTMYLCENFIDPEYPDNSQVRILSPVSVMDFIQFRKEFGQGVRVTSTEVIEEEEGEKEEKKVCKVGEIRIP